MAANAVDFAGTLCGCRYEKELETHFRDCLLFYIDFTFEKLRQYRIILSADTASEVRQMLSQKRR